jgi:hypothetical protein
MFNRENFEYTNPTLCKYSPDLGPEVYTLNPVATDFTAQTNWVFSNSGSFFLSDNATLTEVSVSVYLLLLYLYHSLS